MRYSETLNMRPTTIGVEVIERNMPVVWVPKPMPHAPIWHRLGTPFDRAHFMSCHPPVQVGHMVLPDIGEEDGPHAYLRTPIKNAGTTIVQIPSEMRPILPLLECALETFAAWFPDWTNAHVQATWEGGWVEAGQTQRIPGWHVDGFQGVRQAPSISEASILWSDVQPTEHCVQPFFVEHLDSTKHNVHATLEEQARETNVLVGQPGGIYLIDPYCVHRGTVMPRRMWRNIVRISVSALPLEDPNNSINVGFPGNQCHPIRIEVRDRLWTSKSPVPWEALGFSPPCE